MRPENREKREAEIAAVAYKLLEDKGFDGVSMLMIARQAKASNETLYRWYGGKLGLFKALVGRNADEVSAVLDDLPATANLHTALARIGPVLLGMLLGARAVALNRAAASDATGDLGKALASAGREVVGPKLAALMAIRDMTLSPREAAELYVTLLVGDQQIRRVTGAMPEPSPGEIQARSDIALERFFVLAGLTPG
ncbi:MAG: TetR/AcrR family transcriptional regulator [Pseudomonadota bacterium]